MDADEFMRRLRDQYDEYDHKGAIDEFMLEQRRQWREWAFRLPFIKWPSHLHVRAVPPFARATVRYHVLNPDNGKQISIYLDTCNTLGFMPWPYWEFHGGNLQDTDRCKWDDMETFMVTVLVATSDDLPHIRLKRWMRRKWIRSYVLAKKWMHTHFQKKDEPRAQ